MTGKVYGELKHKNEHPEQVMDIFNKYFTESKSEKFAVNVLDCNSATEPIKDYLSIGLAKDDVFKAL